MTNMRLTFFLYAFSLLGNLSFIHRTVRTVYLLLLIPVIEFLLKRYHSNLVKLTPRHSVISPTFNAFLSDIDTVLIIKNASDSRPLIRHFLLLRKFLIMFDTPEIYTESEYLHLEKLKNGKEWGLIHFCWHLRKIRWCTLSIQNNPHQLTIIKNTRAINSSWAQILKRDIPINKTNYLLGDFKFPETIFKIDENETKLCYCSFFTETIQNPVVVLELSLKEFYYFNSLMPGETIDNSILSSATPFYLNCKIALSYHELYLAKSALRLKKAQDADGTAHKLWCEQLQKNLDIMLSLTTSL